MAKAKKICDNCQLYNPKKGECSVIVLHEGEKINIPVDPQDACFFESEFVEKYKPIEDVKQVKIWVEDPDTGEKAKEGIVKIEYPSDFFGKETDGNTNY